uniref:lasso peptide biosynthesis B2 protein n=1 Tax=Methanobacterium formicicum TaxID=2162 RepID=UPI0024936DFD
VLALKSLYWVFMVRIMVWMFSFPVVQSKVQKKAIRYDPDVKHPVARTKLRIMIIQSSRFVPRATCLIQALAGYILFSKYGYYTSIKIGVLAENGEFEAHAWLEQDEKVVLGESEKDFKTIMDLDGK